MGTYRGQSLATRLVRAIGAGIRERGDIPFLPAAAHYTGAIRLYEQLGDTARTRPRFALLRTPRPVGESTDGRDSRLAVS